MTRFERWAVWSTSVATFVTGVIYLWMKYLVVSDDPLAVVNHPWQPAVLKVHILVAPLLVFSIGLVALRHVWWHFRSKARDGRRSGLLTLVVLGPMIVSGYLIQTMTDVFRASPNCGPTYTASIRVSSPNGATKPSVALSRCLGA